MKLKIVKVAIDEISIQKQKIKEPGDVLNCFNELLEADREQLWALHLNHNLNLISKELISCGGLTRGNTTIREIFKGAILQNASGIILGHIHPDTQKARFSKPDLRFAKAILKAGQIMGITLCDFIVVNSNGDYCSFRLAHSELYKKRDEM